MNKDKKLISVVSPIYNESGNIQNLYDRVLNTFTKLENYDFELIYVDNASVDNSYELIKELINKDPRVKGISMARNFGSSQPSIVAGVQKAIGDAVVVIEGDIQDPPEMIVDFVKKWEEGYQVVYGIRKKRKGSILRRIGYKGFYRLFKKMAYIDIPLDAGDFGLMDRVVVDRINSLDENEVYFRGLRAWVGYKQTGIEYIRDDRTQGKSSISFFSNLKWVKLAIYNFSYKPLEWISNLSLLATVVSILLIIYYVILHFVNPQTPYGFSTIVVLIVFFASLQLLALSVIGEYIIRIFNEVKKRPRYIIKSFDTNIKEEEDK